MFKTIDRYILRELAFPFFIAVGGFIIFILLNLILQLSDFMLDRSIPILIIIRMLIYKLPELLVLSLPVAVLFSVFLALGRLAHDQEIVAMQSGGFSLKRIVIPILIIGMFVGLFDLFLNDRVAPWGNHQYQTLIRQMIYKGQAPKIRDNTFFKGIKNRFFYVHHYDRDQNVMENIMIYDLTGGFELPQLSGKYPKVITAKRAVWKGNTWSLENGVIHKYNDQGDLEYKAGFETMEIEVGRDLQNLFVEERTPRGMSLAELSKKINALSQSGLNYDSLLVEYHSKISIPLASFVFALFAAPLSLMFGKRSKAVGIVIALLLVGMFQGTLLWSQTLGRRGIINPSLSAWIPNLLFGLVGVILFFLMDRIHRFDLWDKIKRMLPLILTMLLLTSILPVSSWASENGDPAPPIDIHADLITVKEDLGKIEGSGEVNLTYEDNQITTDRIVIFKVDKDVWEAQAEGHVHFKNKEIETEARVLEAVLQLNDEDQLISKKITLTKFSAKVSRGPNSTEFKCRGKQATLIFDGGIEEIKIQGKAEFEAKQEKISAEKILITKDQKEETQDGSKASQSEVGNLWQLEARGNVLLTESKRSTQAEKLTLRFWWVNDRELKILDSKVEKFVGRSPFVNSREKKHTIQYQGERANLSFDKKNEVQLIDVRSGDFTTCIGCASLIEEEAYSINADRLLIYSDYLLVAFDITLRAFGFPVFWYPMYMAPLKETRESPLFPEFGRSGSKGWFAKWRIPFFIEAKKQYGYFLIDYFSKFNELGTGMDLHYTIAEHSGKFRAYRLSGERGQYLDLYITHGLPITEHIDLNLRADMRSGFSKQEEDRKQLLYLNLIGNYSEWEWHLKLSRVHHTKKPEEDEQSYQILERVPEFTLKRKKTTDNLFKYSYGVSWGRYREKRFNKENFYSTDRIFGWLNLDLKKMSLYKNSLRVNFPSTYRFSLYGARNPRFGFGISPSLTWRLSDNLQVRTDHKFQATVGRTPFDFDKMTKKNKTVMGLKFNWDRVKMNLNTGFDFKKSLFDLLKLSLSHQTSYHSLNGSLSYDLNYGRLEKLTAKETIKLGNFQVIASGGYKFEGHEFEPLVLKTSLGKVFKLGVMYDLDRGYFTKTNLESELDIGQNWGISLKGEYDLMHWGWNKLQYGLIRKFCHGCWQVGLYAQKDRIWLAAQINAFPTAKVKYSPTDKRLSFGEQK